MKVSLASTLARRDVAQSVILPLQADLKFKLGYVERSVAPHITHLTQGYIAQSILI